MTNLMTKSSLYDMVSMIIPGYLFILCTKIASGIEVFSDFDAATKAIIVFVSSWGVGLLLHFASKDIFNPVLRNLECDIRKANIDAHKIIKSEQEIRDYNKKYYKLMPHYTISVVPILEAQVAFLRSLLLVIPAVLYAIIIKSCSNYNFDNSTYWFMAYIIIMTAVYLVPLCLSRHWDDDCLCLLVFLIFCIFVLMPMSLYFIKKDDIEFMESIFALPNSLSFFLAALFEVAMFLVMRCRQQEIYRHVFEDDYYNRMIATKR